MTSKSRRPSVSELLVLVSATAAGLALTRELPEFLGFEERVSFWNQINPGGSRSGTMVDTVGLPITLAGRPITRRPSYWLAHLPYWAAPCFASWTVAAMALGLRAPGRRRARRPGVAAGLAVLLSLVALTTRCIQFDSTHWTSIVNFWGNRPRYFLYAWIMLPRFAGYTVAVWWLALATSGRWSAEPTASGRLGRALGWSWIALGISAELGVWCFAFNL